MVRPQDCVILFGVPTDYKGFRRDIGAANKDLVPNRCPVWPQYRNEVVVPAERLIATALQCGVRVERDAALHNVHSACDGRHSVVILVAHWTRDDIELADGLHPFRNIVEQVFEGFVDLCVCVSDRLAFSLRELRPRCIIKFALGTFVIPSIWFGFFEALFTYLGEGLHPYMNAYNDIIGNFLQPRGLT